MVVHTLENLCIFAFMLVSYFKSKSVYNFLRLDLTTFNEKVKLCNCQENTTQKLSLNINLLRYCTLNAEYTLN